MEKHHIFQGHGITDTGLRRPHNEDNFAINCDAGFCLVADGMGGAAAGEVASQLFTECASRLIGTSSIRSEKVAVALVKEIYLLANTSIRSHITNNPEHSGMGCTADLLLFHEHGFALGHIGDSRTYRLRDKNLVRLTKDHSLVQDQLDQGIISKDEARTHRLRNVISRAVGVHEQLEVDIIRGRYFTGDLFLLCSDGLTDMVGEQDIEKTVTSNFSLQERTQLLIEQAKAAGGKDNITAILIEVTG